MSLKHVPKKRCRDISLELRAPTLSIRTRGPLRRGEQRDPEIETWSRAAILAREKRNGHPPDAQELAPAVLALVSLCQKNASTGRLRKAKKRAQEPGSRSLEALPQPSTFLQPSDLS